MRTLLLAISLLSVLPVHAVTPHQATPAEELRPHVVFKRELPPVPDDFNAAATKAFNVTARQFRFDFSPSPFVVNQGDSVTVTLTSADVEHGFFLQNYMNDGIAIDPGETRTVSFVANTPGTFTFFCSIVCGSGHSTMGGTFVVNAVQLDPPTIRDFTPLSGPPAGGNAVVITGTGFVNNATVRFGNVPAIGVTVNSPTQITLFAPAANAGTVTITVTNPDGQSATSSTLYTYAPPGQPGGKRRRATRR